MHDEPEMAGPAAAWFPDPTGRFELRYWDGQHWTDHVSTHGVTSTDALPDRPPETGSLPDSGAVTASGSVDGREDGSGFFARRRAAHIAKLEGMDTFETLALRAADGDPTAVTQLPAAVADARRHYKAAQFEAKRLQVLATAVRAVIDDDILSQDEEEHLANLLFGLDLTLDDLQRRDLHLFEEMVTARINDGRPPELDQVSLALKRGEVANADFAPVALMKEQAVRQYRGGSSGVSIPIGFGMRYRTSSTRGRSVVVGTQLVAADRGQLIVTSTRAVFVGAAKTLEFRHDKLVGLQQFTDGLRLNVSNRQTASLFKFTHGQSPAIAAALISWHASHQSAR